jgi:hypothetical protein
MLQQYSEKSRWLARAVAAMAATAMLFTSSGCGDSGATGGSTTASTSTSTPSPTAGGSISVGAGTTSTLSSASGSSITLTAVVKNSGNAALANQTVSFTTTDAGVTIGVETALDATGEAALLDEIGSPAIRSYFNFASALQNGRDLHAELRTLGADRICQIHASNQDGVWLEKDPAIDLPAVKHTLDELGWSGWLVVERSRDAADARNVRGNFGANVRTLKRVFQGA